jgi:hypothetical protein
MKRIKRPSDICVICGLNPATSWDHLPPDGIFPKPKPVDPIEVPACEKCNSGSSDYDQIFQVFIGLAAGHGETGEKMFKEHVTKILRSNRRLKRSIAQTLRYVDLKTPAGNFLGRAEAVLHDSRSYDSVIERIIRGLHFYHTGYILGDKVDIKIRFHRKLTVTLFNMASSWLTGSVGGDQFIYRYAIFKEEPLASAWVLQFFKKTWSSATILPKNGDREQGNQPGRE